MKHEHADIFPPDYDEGAHDPIPAPPGLFVGIINALRIMSHAGLWIAAVYLLAGCSTVRPLVEYQHQSHATQHFGENRTNYGYDVLSAGIRWRPYEKITVDLLEGYSLQEFQGRREVFTGRVQIEF